MRLHRVHVWMVFWLRQLTENAGLARLARLDGRPTDLNGGIPGTAAASLSAMVKLAGYETGTVVCAWLALSAAVGCNMPKYVADTNARMNEETAHVIEAFFDVDVALEAMPSLIVQYEAMLSLSPENTDLMLSLAQFYQDYASVFLRERAAEATGAGDEAAAARFLRRAGNMHLRAKELALNALQQNEALAGDPTDHSALAKQLRSRADAQDLRALVLAGSAWGDAVDAGVAEAGQLPLAQAFVERAVAVDPSYGQCSGLSALGALRASDEPEQAKAHFERALTLCERRNHNLQVAYARSYALGTKNRELYVKLLEEVIEAEDAGDDVRLRNAMARRQARRYLAQASELF